MFQEPLPDLIAPNPGGAADPLGESVLDPALPALRLFEPRDVRVVIGRHQDPTREVRIEAARTDRIPIHRRHSGGGTVVLAPGMIVIALRLPPGDPDPAAWFARINAVIAPGVAAVIGREPDSHRLGDLTLTGPDGIRRKILGASLRQNARMVVYLGALLVADAVPLMERYLLPPSREPDYRAGRGHAAFCDHLARYGTDVAQLSAALRPSLAGLTIPG